MCLLPQDQHFLSRALTLAQEAAAFASPNPTVGCVLTRDDGSVLGEGAHFYDTRHHAEIAALRKSSAKGLSTAGATAFVTLEPCTHHGRTGPCADALIAAGITRCVIATADPNPQVHGQGIARLRAAGIEVHLADPASDIAQQARRLNDAFAFSIRHGRPFVTLKAALSVDGKLAPPSAQRTGLAPHWLTGKAARADVQLVRYASDAVLTGIGTVLADNPSLADRSGLPRRRPLLRIVLDTHLRTPIDSEIVRSCRNDVLLIAGSSASDHSVRAFTQRGVEVLFLPVHRGRLDLTQALHALASRNLRSLLVEAGPTLNGSLLASGLVDRAVLYYSETELGPNALPFADNFPSPYVLQQQLQHTERHAFPHGRGEDIRISGNLHDPWANLNPNP